MAAHGRYNGRSDAGGLGTHEDHLAQCRGRDEREDRIYVSMPAAASCQNGANRPGNKRGVIVSFSAPLAPMTSSCTEGRSKITTLGLRRSSLYTKSLIELSCKRKMEPELKVTASYAVATSLRLKLVFNRDGPY